jgi:hypothetical protein
LHVLCLKQENHLVWIVDIAEEIYFLQAGFLPSRQMVVIDRFPLREVGDFVADEEVWHMRDLGGEG